MKKVVNGIMRIFNPIICEEVLTQFKPVAHVTQKIETVYPNRRMNNSKSTGIFTDVEPNGQVFEQVRHCLVPIPEGATVETVNEKLSKFPEGVIQKIVTNNIQDILTEGDQWALSNIDPATGQSYTTLSALEEKYATRDKEGNRYSGGELRVSKEGTVVNDSLPEEYSRNFYQNHFVEDLDLTTKVSVEAKAEIVS